MELKVKIENLNIAMKSNDLQEEFSHFGNILYACVYLNKETRKSNGYRIICFENSDDAAKAIKFINNQEIWGKIVRVKIDLPSLIRYLSSNIEDIQNITSRQFEELVAELLKKNTKYKIELTPSVKDGGKDIIAIQSDGVVENKLYFECKLHDNNHPIGVNIIKHLHSTVVNDKVTKGILVATSKLTKGAKKILHQNRWMLESKEINDIFNWIKLYVKEQFGISEEDISNLEIEINENDD